MVEFAAALYGDEGFLRALYNALTEDGIIVTQVGDAPTLFDVPEVNSLHKNRAAYVNALIELGFQSILDYQEVSRSHTSRKLCK